jgi:ankyrin repeat protein
LFIACERGEKEIIQELLDANANVNEEDLNGNTALLIGILLVYSPFNLFNFSFDLS